MEKENREKKVLDVGYEFSAEKQSGGEIYEYMRMEREQAYEEGWDAGQKAGEEAGKEAGKEELLSFLIQRKLAKGKNLPEIAEALEMDEETIRGLMEKKELNKETI